MNISCHVLCKQPEVVKTKNKIIAIPSWLHVGFLRCRYNETTNFSFLFFICVQLNNWVVHPTNILQTKYYHSAINNLLHHFWTTNTKSSVCILKKKVKALYSPRETSTRRWWCILRCLLALTPCNNQTQSIISKFRHRLPTPRWVGCTLKSDVVLKLHLASLRSVRFCSCGIAATLNHRPIPTKY